MTSRASGSDDDDDDAQIAEYNLETGRNTKSGIGWLVQRRARLHQDDALTSLFEITTTTFSTTALNNNYYYYY